MVTCDGLKTLYLCVCALAVLLVPNHLHLMTANDKQPAEVTESKRAGGHTSHHVNVKERLHIECQLMLLLLAIRPLVETGWEPSALLPSVRPGRG